MSEKVLNTKDVLRQNTKSQSELEREFEAASRKMNAKMVDAFIPEAYRATFGNPFEFSVNAVTISVPIGERVSIPEPHAKHLQILMKGAVTDKALRSKMASQVVKENLSRDTKQFLKSLLIESIRSGPIILIKTKFNFIINHVINQTPVSK